MVEVEVNGKKYNIGGPPPPGMIRSCKKEVGNSKLCQVEYIPKPEGYDAEQSARKAEQDRLTAIHEKKNIEARGSGRDPGFNFTPRDRGSGRDPGFNFIPRVGMVGSSVPSNVGGPQPDHLNPKPWAGWNANW